MATILGRQHTELVAIRVGHDHPADFALADVDARRAERDETIDLRLLVVVAGEVENASGSSRSFA